MITGCNNIIISTFVKLTDGLSSPWKSTRTKELTSLCSGCLKIGLLKKSTTIIMVNIINIEKKFSFQIFNNQFSDGFIPLDLTNELNSRVATGDSTLEISIGIPIKPNQKAFTDIVTRKEQV